MSTFTNFIKLHKPAETEKYNVNLFNANAELIDSALARIEQENERRDNLLDTLKTKATDLADGLLSKEDHAKYEDANNKKHSHANKTVLDSITTALISAWNTVTDKVDKVAGKDLSSNDYTTEEKNKLSGIESGAKANVQADWNVSDAGSDAYIKNKPNLAAYAPSVMTGATANAAGKAGNVPAPAKGKHNAYLRGDGTWQETSTSLTATVPGIPLDHTVAKVLKDQINEQNSNLSELGVISNIKQSGNKNIAANTWTKILSLTLTAGTYIITGQLDVYGKQNTSKYIAIVDSAMFAYNASNFILTQVYTQVVTILTITSTQTISVAAYSTTESATVSNGVLTALKMK